MNKSIYFPALLYFTSILILGGCKHGSDNKTESETSKRESQIITLSKKSISEIGLSVVTAEMKTLTGSLDVHAKLIPDQDLEAQVGSFVQGRVRKVFVGLGDYVRHGEELMQIEGLGIGEIKAKFIMAKAKFTAVEATLKRQKALMEQKVGSQKALIEAQFEYDKALAEFNAEDEKIHSVGLTDEDLSMFVENPTDENHSQVGGTLPIKSPINGIVVERNVAIGQLVDASTNAFKIINTASLWADGQVYEKDIPKLKSKSDVSLTISAFPDRKFNGKIIYIGETINEQSRTVKVRAVVPNENRLLKPEMYAEMHIPVTAAAPSIVVPNESVVSETGGAYLFVATSDSTFEKKTVETGISTDSFTEIREGLKKGDKVVLKGLFYLKSELKKEEMGGE